MQRKTMWRKLTVLFAVAGFVALMEREAGKSIAVTGFEVLEESPAPASD